MQSVQAHQPTKTRCEAHAGKQSLGCILEAGALLTNLMRKVHGGSSFQVSYLLTKAAVVALGGLHLGFQSLTVLLQLLHLRLQLC